MSSYTEEGQKAVEKSWEPTVAQHKKEVKYMVNVEVKEFETYAAAKECAEKYANETGWTVPEKALYAKIQARMYDGLDSLFDAFSGKQGHRCVCGATDIFSEAHLLECSSLSGALNEDLLEAMDGCISKPLLKCECGKVVTISELTSHGCGTFNSLFSLVIEGKEFFVVSRESVPLSSFLGHCKFYLGCEAVVKRYKLDDTSSNGLVPNMAKVILSYTWSTLPKAMAEPLSPDIFPDDFNFRVESMNLDWEENNSESDATNESCFASDESKIQDEHQDGQVSSDSDFDDCCIDDHDEDMDISDCELENYSGGESSNQVSGTMSSQEISQASNYNLFSRPPIIQSTGDSNNAVGCESRPASNNDKLKGKAKAEDKADFSFVESNRPSFINLL
ncbi:hypothetical protein HDU99_003856 [Rhizoclosmatium hyalinum]|nr:hypothetical protein HDU99_003856 [Rhizoclosmatium hyalinum]